MYMNLRLRYIAARECLDFPDLVLRLLADRQRVCAYVTDCLLLQSAVPTTPQMRNSCSRTTRGGLSLGVTRDHASALPDHDT
jgi:hypothetical protein